MYEIYVAGIRAMRYETGSLKYFRGRELGRRPGIESKFFWADFQVRYNGPETAIKTNVVQ